MGHQRDLARFTSKFLCLPNGCWQWMAGKKGGGYGQFWYGGKLHGAHRISLLLFMGKELDSGLDVMHSCDNTGCVNPEHLKYGTRADNMRDASRKGRTVRVQDWHGTANPKAKLSDSDRLAVEVRIRAGERNRLIADDFGVSAVRVQQIAREIL